MIRYRHAATFADVPLDIVSLSTDLGRDVIQWRPARGRGAQLQDRGQRPRQYDLQIVIPGTPAEVTERRDALLAIRDAGTARTFTHPLDGPIVCRLSDLTESLTPGELSYRITLTEDVPFALRIQRDAQVDRVTLSDVTAAADEYDAAVEELALTADDLADSLPSSDAGRTAASSWTPGETTPDAIRADLEPLRADNKAALAALDRDPSLDAYQAAVKLIDFAGTLQRYAWEVERTAARVASLQLDQTAPLIQILSAFYGAETAARRIGEIATMNDIRNPLRVACGTVLRLPLYE